MCDMTYRYVWHGTLTWLLHGCICHIHMWMWHVDVAYPDESSLMCDWVMSTFTSGHDSIKDETWLIFVCVRLGSCLCVSWFLHTCTMTHPCRWHDLCIRVPYDRCHMNHRSTWHDSFICETWRVHTCDMTHEYFILSCQHPSKFQI